MVFVSYYQGNWAYRNGHIFSEPIGLTAKTIRTKQPAEVTNISAQQHQYDNVAAIYAPWSLWTMQRYYEDLEKTKLLYIYVFSCFFPFLAAILPAIIFDRAR